MNIGEAYAAKGDYRQALEYTKQAMTHLRYDRDQRRVLANLVKYSYKCRQTGATGEYLTRLYRQNREDLVKFFADLTLQEKNEYLKRIVDSIKLHASVCRCSQIRFFESDLI